ncbi:unnamed protein product [Lampetra planeri]
MGRLGDRDEDITAPRSFCHGIIIIIIASSAVGMRTGISRSTANCGAGVIGKLYLDRFGAKLQNYDS